MHVLGLALTAFITASQVLTTTNYQLSKNSSVLTPERPAPYTPARSLYYITDRVEGALHNIFAQGQNHQ